MKALDLRQLDTRNEETLRRDLGRLTNSLEATFGKLSETFRERWAKASRTVTASTPRPVLAFGQASIVDTKSDDVVVRLPKATPADAGRSAVIIKRYAVQTATLRPVDNSLVNTFTEWPITQIGVHEAWWDGTAWWLKEPAARVRKHDTEHQPLGLWQFDHGDLTDSSGNGRTLTVDKGTSCWSQLYPGLDCLFFNGDTTSGVRLIYNVADTALRLTGDLTIEMLAHFRTYSGTQTFISHGGSTEDEVQNILYSVAMTDTFQSRWLHEQGAGANEVYGVDYQPQDEQICHFAVTRSSNVIQFYLNGRALGAASSALNAATGGADGRLYIGGSATGSWAGYLASVKLIGSALTAAEIRAEYNRTMGPAFGFLDD